MAAYGAAVSLKNTIQRIVRPSPRISLLPSSRQILQPAYEAMCRLQNVLLKLDGTGYSKIRTKVDDWDDRIKQAVWKFEDELETNFTDQILPELESKTDHLPFSLDLQSLRHSVDDLVKRLEVLEEDYLTELANMPEEDVNILSRIDSSGIDSNMVGPSAQFEDVRNLLINGNENQLLVTGIAGVGKTTLAKKVFEDPLIQEHFKLRAWVRVGRKCGFNETFQCILAQVDPSAYDQMLIQGDGDDDQKLVGLVKEGLKDKKCLIVFNDVWQWHTRVMDNLPQVNVQILLTSRQAIEGLPYTVEVNLLDPETSMKLLSRKVFPAVGFPPHLEELGKRIASKCEGLPLMIVTVAANLLPNKEESLKYWREVADKKYNSVFKNAYGRISKVLVEGKPILWRTDSSGINSNMVGSSVQFENVKKLLIKGEKDQLLVTGMAGVGKTTLAKKVFEDPSIRRNFKLRAWVKVDRKCGFNETFRCILAQVDPTTYDQILIQGDGDDDQKLVGLVKEGLKDNKCLIVFDDVWQWHARVMDNLPQVNVQILLTSRQAIEGLPYTVEVNLLDPETSMKLLSRKVFPAVGFPPHLEELGKRIANKCEGLPLMIVTVAKYLSKQDKTPKYWMEVANKQHNSVFKDAYDEIYKVLLPSYNYLPQHLKMFFLYCGAFPPYQDIEIHDLFKRLYAEGFLEPVGKQALEIFTDKKEDFEYFNKGKQDLVLFMSKCRHELVHYYHLLIGNSNGNSRVHSCWQHLCKKNAIEIKFLHVLQNWYEVVTDQRRVCTNHNSLFAFKHMYDIIKRECASTARSFLCFGPYHQYPLPIHDMGFKLLKVLDALKVRFYHIPDEILKLVCLKYLALTCNNELPPSISNLFHLQSLIISQHMSIKRRGAMSYMPAEIWDMQELQHIEVTGRDLPTPKSDATLDKLSYLSGVSKISCTREILKRVCNLNKLQIVTVLKPYDDEVDINPQSDLRYISEELQNLYLLKYRLVNPCIGDLEMKNVLMLPLSMFPKGLVNLSLSGLACPWEHMNDIGSLLPNLQNLELKHYAFRGPEWDIEPECFLKLRKLTVEDTDLVRWRVQHGSLPELSELSIQHCYKLQQFDWVRDPSMVMTAIKLVECNYSAEASAKQLTPKSCFDVKVHRDEKS